MSAAPGKALALSLALAVAAWPSNSTAKFLPRVTTPITVETGKPVPADRIYQAELATPSPGHTAKVTFLRDKGMVAGLITYKIAVDGKAGFAMHAGEFQTLYLTPGAHTFALSLNSQLFTETAITADLQNTVKFSHSVAIGHGAMLGDGESETYRISTTTNDLVPSIETVEATNGAPLGPWSGLQGHIEGGRYFAPSGKVAFTAPKNAGVILEFLRDSYSPGVERGHVVRFNEGELQAVHYASLAGLGIAPPVDSSAYRAALDKAWRVYAMPGIFNPAADRAEVVYQEHVVDQGKEMLFSIVKLPGMSNDGRVRDGYPAALVSIDGDYAVLLRRWDDSPVEAKWSPKERAAGALPKLLALRSELDFKQETSPPSGQ